MLQSKLDVLTTTALQSDTIYGELGSLKKKTRTNSILYGPALLLLLAACGGGGGGGGTVAVSSPEPADTDDTPAEDVRVKVGAGPADAEGVHRATTDSVKIDIDAEAVQPTNLSAIYKSGDDGADITLEFVDAQNQLSHVFTISNGADGELDITVDNKALFINLGEDIDPDNEDDLSGSNNYVSFIDGGLGNDTLSGGENEHNLFGFSGDDFGNDTIVNPSPKSEGYINSGDIISFINYVLRRPTDDVELREGLTEAELVTPTFEGEALQLSTNNGSSVTVNNGAYLDICIRSSHGDVENFIYALSSPDRELRGTNLPDIIFGRGGADTIKALASNDEIVGGAGIDTLSYANETQSLLLRFHSGSFGEAALGDVVSNFENIIGTSRSDIISGDDNDNVIEGGDQGLDAEYLDGRGGNDTVSYASSDAGVNVNLGSTSTLISNGSTFLYGHSGGHADNDYIANFENIIGSAYGDNLTGDSGVNILDGAGGDDTLAGNGGNDVFVAHIAEGDTDTIADFSDGDKVRIDVDDPSAISDLASLYAALSITVTNDTDQTGNGANDTVVRFDRGTTGADANDYLIVFEGFTDDLDYADFDIV